MEAKYVSELKLENKGEYMWFDTRAVILTSGVGTGSREIVAFDAALRNAAIADFNLIKVTSIVPPGVPVYKMKKGAPEIVGDGHMLPAVYAKVSSNVDGELLSSAVGVGIPDDRERCGVIFVNKGKNLEESECVSGLDAMIAEGMQKLRRFDTHNFQHASATATRADDGAEWHATLAALCFADEHLWPYFKDWVEQVS